MGLASAQLEFGATAQIAERQLPLFSSQPQLQLELRNDYYPLERGRGAPLLPSR